MEISSGNPPQGTQSLSIQEEKTSNGVQLSLQGEFISGSTEKFMASVKNLSLEKGQVVSLDMHQVSYLDSGALGCLLLVQSQLNETGIRMVLDKASWRVEELLRRINCWDLFNPEVVDWQDGKRLEAYSSLGEVLSLKVNLLTILMTTAGDIAGTLEEPYLCKKIVHEMAAQFKSDQVFLYLKQAEGKDPDFFLAKEEVNSPIHSQVPMMLAGDEFKSFRLAQGKRIRSQVFQSSEIPSEALAQYLFQSGSPLVLVSPLLGMQNEIGWLIMGLKPEIQPLVEDNFRSIDLFLKIGGLLLDNVRSGEDREVQFQEVSKAMKEISRSDKDQVLFQKATSLNRLLLRLTRRLNNQLVPVLGYTQMLLKTGQMMSLDKERLERIEESIQSAKRLINSLIGLTTQPSLALSRVSLNEICKLSVRQLGKEVPSIARFPFQWQLDSDLPDTFADARQSELAFPPGDSECLGIDSKTIGRADSYSIPKAIRLDRI